MTAEKKTTSKKSPAKKSAAQPKRKKRPTVTVAADKTTAEFDARLRKIRRTAADRRAVSVKNSIAEKVAFRRRNRGTILSCIAMTFLLLLAAFFMFCLQGYSFSALVCLCLTFIIGFYTFVPKLREKFPKFTRTVTRIFTIILCIGLLIVGITEALIIKASFGGPQETTEYLVVLGAKVRSDRPSLSLQNRIDTAYEYMMEHPDVIAVVTGGQGPDEPTTEARCMYEHLTEMGIDPSRIWMEDKATSTWENLHFSLDLIEEKTGTRPEKIAVLSSEYHLFRASLFADACNVEFVGVPAETTIWSLKINYFLREVAGVWHYILLGSLGGKYHA